MKKINLILAVLLLFTIANCGGNADTLKVSDPAPDFTLQDHLGNEYSRSDYEGESPVVIYFYPKAGTPGCTDQACGIRDEYQKFEDNNIVILGISVDSKNDIAEFVKDQSLNFPLLSDESKEVATKYDVLNDFGMANRITFIIDKEGMIAEIIRDVDVETHAEEVFEIAAAL